MREFASLGCCHVILSSWEENETLSAVHHLSLDPFLPLLHPSFQQLWFTWSSSYPGPAYFQASDLALALTAWTVLSPVPHLACSYSP